MRLKPHHHIANAAAIGPVRKLAGDVKGINAKVAVIVSNILGSMPFFYFAIVLAICSLPAVLTTFDSEVLKGTLGLMQFFPSVLLKASVIALVAWIAQTFVQLVALPVLQVSNNAQMAQTEEHTHIILDRLDLDTKGGVEILDKKLDKLIDQVERGTTS